MIQSVRWPFQKTSRGGLARTTTTDHGNEETEQTVTLAHIPGRSNNPWDEAQDVGCPDATFGGGRVDIAAVVVHSRSVFRRLEDRGRARLDPGYPRVEPNRDGEAAVVVEYTNLESGSDGRVEVP